MDDQLARLETKVLEAIEIIHGLRQENAELRDRCQEQEQRLADVDGRLQDAERARERLQHDLNEARETAAQVERFEEKRRQVEEKVGGLLSKLEAMS